jgi:hypothetical protein
MRRLDRYHAECVGEFHDLDIDDPALGHLMLDATSLDTVACVDLIEMAARAIV